MGACCPVPHQPCRRTERRPGDLDTLSAGGKGEYLPFGYPTRISDFIPGMQISVIGPPPSTNTPPWRPSAPTTINTG